MRLVTWSLILMSPVLLGGCHTIQGFGEDMSAAGRALSNASDTVLGNRSQSPPPVTELPPPGQGSSTMPQTLSPAARPQGDRAEPK